jgi:hypothetical protein
MARVRGTDLVVEDMAQAPVLVLGQAQVLEVKVPVLERALALAQVPALV